MKWLKRIALTLLVLCVAFVAIAFFLPSHVHVERSATIARPPATVFALLDSFRRFNDWSPWTKYDPNSKYTWSGPDAGVGAKLAWSGDPRKVGNGSQEITAHVPGKSIEIKLDFGDQGGGTARFDLAPDGTGTRVRWSFDTDLPLSVDAKLPMNAIGRWFGLMFDSMIGKDYAEGLVGLKKLAETLPAVDLAGFEATPVELPARALLAVSAESDLAAGTAGAVLGAAYQAIGTFAQASGVAVQDAPMTITHGVDQGVWKFDAARAVDRAPEVGTDQVKVAQAQTGKAIETLHVGSYDNIPATLAKLDALLAAQGYKRRGELIAEYVDDPGTVPMPEVKTKLIQPVE